ncbi:hypothetical protein PHMEG_00032711 [Phytophthora megakarya]|uniref:Major Facilitator Superfamily (MFS) transporter n=1 Tax=Phytophthora megakarya TaxID=4795 RepID=A0A225UVE6_9STRA|nr:hypothetical protein PHMEG_00032711 [Phytophthora megakarya]
MLTQPHIWQITAGIFVLLVVSTIRILSETLPAQKSTKKTQWVVDNPFDSILMLLHSRLFVTLTCLIALTSFASEGIFQIQLFYLNVVVGFDVTDFGNLMLFNGVLAIVGQGLLLDPLVKCTKEKGVIILALVGGFWKAFGIVCRAFYPRKWLVYVLSVPGCLSEFSLPAISALMSINRATYHLPKLL